VEGVNAGRFSKDCWRLDEWLQERFGRPYIILLGIGLIIDIGHRVSEVHEEATKPHRLLGLALGIALELGLLIHQLGELHHHSRPREKLTKAEAEK
jgi:hypothetical protein